EPGGPLGRLASRRSSRPPLRARPRTPQRDALTTMTSTFSPDAAAALPGPQWLVDRRRAAAERFAGAELPSAEEEVWRYSRTGDLALDRYRPSTAEDAAGADHGRADTLLE